MLSKKKLTFKMFWNNDIFIVGVGWVMILFFQLCLLYFSCISNGEKIIFLSPPAEPAAAPTTPPTEPPAAPIIDSPPTPPTDDNVESGK